MYAIEQDAQGFMWFGTREGLNRYDSEEIITFYHDETSPNSLLSNNITALKASGNKLLIGTDHGLCIFNHELGSFEEWNYEGSSLGYVNQITYTSDSSLFVATSKGLFTKKTDASKFTKLISETNIVDFLEYKKGVYWVSSIQNLWMINQYGETISQFEKLDPSASEVVDLGHNVSSLFKDTGGSVWVGTRKNGLLKHLDNGTFEQVLTRHDLNSLEMNIVRTISEDNLGRLWIATESGVLIYDPANDHVEILSQDFDDQKQNLSDKAIYSIEQSRDGIMWVGTYFGGVNMINLPPPKFKTLHPRSRGEGLSGKAVSTIIEPQKDVFWIGTEDGGISIWNKGENQFSYLRNLPGVNGLSVDNVHEIYQDDDEAIWIGTFLGGLNRYNSATGQVTVHKGSAQRANAFSHNMVYSVHRDAKDRLWIGTQGGLNLYNEKDGSYEPFNPDRFAGKFIYDIYEDRKEGLWLCINNSPTIYYLDSADRIIEYQFTKSDFSGSEASIGVISAFEDPQGIMWFGTYNYGLLRFDPRTEQFKHYNVKDGLTNNYVYGILKESKRNVLWLSTNKGLNRFDIDTEQFTSYNISHGLPNNQFNFKSYYQAKDGTMYFGTINGLCYFHPDSLTENIYAPLVYFSDFKLFNKSVEIGEEFLLKKSLNTVSQIELEYRQNVLTFEFVAINYLSHGNNQYAYYMDGFEKEWNYVGNRKSATYTNLSPGNYIFKVKAANNDGVWSDEVRTVAIKVHPPFWASSWALVLYSGLLIAFFFLYRLFLTYRNKEKMAVQIERIEREKITELNRHKINFFTNISHEFKTPLTLIIASIDKFLLSPDSEENRQSYYKLIRRNARRLQFLIEQLMEFRRMETDHAKVLYSQGDLVLFLKDTFMAFQPAMAEKDLSYNFTSNRSSFHAYFDDDKLEKIVTNLISNAIKHTDTRGSIDIDVNILKNTGDDKRVQIIISDTGHGMSQEEIEHIFSPFYRTETGKQVSPGSGIGLTLVKGLIDFLGGAIQVESNLHRGTYITIDLPLAGQIDQEVISAIDGNKTIDIDHVLRSEPFQKHKENRSNSEYELLIVEDNGEIVNLLKDHFGKKYKIITAGNGIEGLRKLKKNIADIIISDVMMPEMDGYEFCKIVKSNLETSHIPVILLTAKAGADNRLKGINLGADMYVPKPFNLYELELRIRNLLEARQKMRQHFLKFANIMDEEAVPVNNRDQSFLNSLKGIVEKHMEDSDFNITTFAQEAGVSRSLLHLKLKKLVNMSASEFVKTIRLQKAAYLLEKSDLSISEIAYAVGYADPNYFTRSFKEKFSCSPSEHKTNSPH